MALMLRRALSSRVSGPARSVTDYIADALVQQGVRNVFGGHGGAVIPLVNSIAAHPRLRWVYTRNEQAASLAAAADAKLTGRLAVCVATSGPGASHLTTGLIDATQDRVPVLAITGTKPTSSVDLSEFQMIHQDDLYRAAGLPFSHVVMSEQAVSPMLRNAIAVAMREKAAVHLAIPADIQKRTMDLALTHHNMGEIAQLEYQASEGRLHRAAEILQDPQLRVVIALGHRAATELTPEMAASAHNPFVCLAETLNAPIVTQLDAKGCVDEAHPLSYGVMGIFGNPGLDAARELVAAADTILLFGVDRQVVDLISDSTFNQVRRVVEFEPDAGSAAFHRWYTCEAVVLGNLAHNARRLEAEVATLRASPEAVASAEQLEEVRPINSHTRHWTWILRGGWRTSSPQHTAKAGKGQDAVEDNAVEADARPARFHIEHEERQGFCHPARVLQSLGRFLHPDDVVCVDVGDVRTRRERHATRCPRRTARAGAGAWAAGWMARPEENASTCSGRVLPNLPLSTRVTLAPSPTHSSHSGRASASASPGDSGFSPRKAWERWGTHFRPPSRPHCSGPSGELSRWPVTGERRVSAPLRAPRARAPVLFSSGERGPGGPRLSGAHGMLTRRMGAASGHCHPHHAPAGPQPSVTIGELATAVQHQCAITLIIFNNHLLGRVHFGFDGVSGDTLVTPDFVALARAYGGDGVHVSHPREVGGALEAAMRHCGVFVVEVAVDPELKAEFARMRDDSPFLLELRDKLQDLLPTDLRPSDIRRLIAFDADGDGMLSTAELSAARKALAQLKADTRDTAEFLRILRTGQLFKGPVLTSVKQLFMPLDPPPFSVHLVKGREQPHEAGCTIDCIGSVGDVLAARVPDGLRHRRFSAEPYQAGFETAAIDDMDGLGEMCLVDGRVFVRETDGRRPDFFETRESDSFLTTCAVLMPRDATPDLKISLEPRTMPQGVSFVRVMNDMMCITQEPFFFSGHVCFNQCDVTSISRPPTDGMSMVDHIGEYYWRPGAMMHNTRTFACGVVARNEADRPEMLDTLFTRIFYSDLAKAAPHAAAGAFIASGSKEKPVHCHVHVITLQGDKPAEVWHLNPDSNVRSFDVDVFRIRAINVVDG